MAAIRRLTTILKLCFEEPLLRLDLGQGEEEEEGDDDHDLMFTWALPVMDCLATQLSPQQDPPVRPAAS